MHDGSQKGEERKQKEKSLQSKLIFGFPSFSIFKASLWAAWKLCYATFASREREKKGTENFLNFKAEKKGSISKVFSKNVNECFHIFPIQ